MTHAIVFLPLNGIGLGHLSRAFTLSTTLKEQGGRPVIFAQGHYPEEMLDGVPGISIPTVYKLPLPERHRIAQDLISFLRASGGSTVIEDTHPTPIDLPSQIDRILLVRPPAFSYMRHLRRHYRNQFKRFVVTDHPESPTWPYSDTETEEIQSWSNWLVTAPVFRPAPASTQLAVRAKYRLGIEDSCYVFSMGGGGSQRDALLEAGLFCHKSEIIARKIRKIAPQCRLLFVRGPLFPNAVEIPAIFEDIAAEPAMASLFAVATGAIIRPGFNSTWECLASLTPFYTIPGDTFMEPVGDRVDRLVRRQLTTTNIDEWLDPDFLSTFREAAKGVARRWDSKGAAITVCKAFGAKNIEPVRRVPIKKPGPPDPPSAFPLLVRIDDVVTLNKSLAGVLDICLNLGIKPSLEVIPYLTDLEDDRLIDFIGSSDEFEVGQHGFAHLPRRTSTDRKAEFTNRYVGLEDLTRGFSTMQARFPMSFRGGFSSPFDYCPKHLPATWFRLGGEYITSCRDRQFHTQVPNIRLTLDPWNWLINRPLPEMALLDEAFRSKANKGYVGVVLHPSVLESTREQNRIRTLLGKLINSGGRPTKISAFAHEQHRKPAAIQDFLNSL